MPLVKGALIEYSGDFLGPLPNVVLFQFNPESLTREIQIPPRGIDEESAQAGNAPTELISFTAQFNASDYININDPIAREFGIGTQLAALEKMIYPEGKISQLIGEQSVSLDSVGDSLTSITNMDDRGIPIPRLSYPRILFIWGKTRILPVIIQSMRITEDQFDPSLNPIRAKVDISLAVQAGRGIKDDKIALGALEFTSIIKEAQAVVNLTNTLKELPNYLASETKSIIPI